LSLPIRGAAGKLERGPVGPNLVGPAAVHLENPRNPQLSSVASFGGIAGARAAVWVMAASKLPRSASSHCSAAAVSRTCSPPLVHRGSAAPRRWSPGRSSPRVYQAVAVYNPNSRSMAPAGSWLVDRSSLMAAVGGSPDRT
jgi:hypothetical protein